MAWRIDQHIGYQCTQHWGHRIDCDMFVAMLARAGGGCEICRRPWLRDVHTRKPFIDHDHDNPIWAVRGLLCLRCNSTLSQAERGSSMFTIDQLAYLGNAWFRTDGREHYTGQGSRVAFAGRGRRARG
jgi:hypothetical protein